MIVYNKLVRDRIPEIIEQSGKACEVRVLSPEEYRTKLHEKLLEEIKEYNHSGEVTELADLVEVVYAILDNEGISTESFEKLREAKKSERGAFRKRLLLVHVSE